MKTARKQFRAVLHLVKLFDRSLGVVGIEDRRIGARIVLGGETAERRHAYGPRAAAGFPEFERSSALGQC
jgi:hypothetical protein